MKANCAALFVILALGVAQAEAQGGFGLLLRSTPPGLAFQVRPCPDDEEVDKAVRKLRRSLQDPVTEAEPDVRSTCLAAGGGGILTIGVWLNPLPLDLPWSAALRRVQDAARNRGLSSVMMIGVNEAFAWSATSGFLTTLRDRTWESMPHQLDVNGNADEDGPIVLSRLSYALLPPDAIRTQVRGRYVEVVDLGPLGDMELDFDFRLRQTDTVSIDERGKLRMDSESDLDVDTDMLDWLIGFLYVHFPPLGWDAEQRLDAMAVGAPNLGPVTFGGVIVSAAPDKILLEGGLKLDYEHWRFEVAETGVTGGGGVNLVARDPTVTISGPRSERVTVRTVTLRYSMVPDDLRASDDVDLQIEWTADGVVSDPAAWATDIEFEVPANVPPGGETEKAVSVRVTDADGLEAVSEITVRITYDPLDRPPICRKKPWLPECRPGIDRN